ncbi:MAG: hypothetical protein CMH23_10540 [Methylophaga sp.]|nr:hypothetical protein [Methylophaga sp.]
MEALLAGVAVVAAGAAIGLLCILAGMKVQSSMRARAERHATQCDWKQAERPAHIVCRADQ